jgi:hypothetical protein
MRRLANSPYRSPHENSNKAEYFVQNGRLSASAAQRPRPSRHNSEDRIADSRRRSSVPELVFNQDGEARPDSKGKSSRSQSAQRISSGPYYPPPTHTAGLQRHPTSAHRNSNTSSSYRPSINGSNDANGHRRHGSSGATTTPRRRNRSPSTINESTGSEASSEDSRTGQDRKKQDSRRRSSLWPPSFVHHRRRHSHDATYDVSERAPPLPPRPPPLQTHVPRSEHHPKSPQSATRRRGVSNLNSVQFRNDVFQAEQAASSAPETPVAPDYPPPLIPVPRMRYDPPPQNMHLLQGPPLSRTTSGEINREDSRSGFVPPARSKIVTMGVGGRRYPGNGNGDKGDLRSGGSTARRKDRTMSAAPIGVSQSG